MGAQELNQDRQEEKDMPSLASSPILSIQRVGERGGIEEEGP